MQTSDLSSVMKISSH